MLDFRVQPVVVHLLLRALIVVVPLLSSVLELARVHVGVLGAAHEPGIQKLIVMTGLESVENQVEIECFKELFQIENQKSFSMG